LLYLWEAPMTPTPPVDLSEVPTPDLIRMLRAALVHLTVASRLAGKSREPIPEAVTPR
jgi:hypothetical protein